MSNFNINGTNTNLTQIFYSLSSPDATAQTTPTGFKYNDGGTEKDLITLFAKYVQGDLAPTTNYISTAYGNADLNTIFQNISVSPVLYSVTINSPNINYNVNTNNGFTGLIFYINTGSIQGRATFTLNRNYNMTIIVIAGGGGGGGGNGGGGGGGGTIYFSASFTAGSYPIIVGSGGTGGVNGGGGDGNTSFLLYTAYPGLGGGGSSGSNGGKGGYSTEPNQSTSFGGGGGGGGGVSPGGTTTGGLGGYYGGSNGQGLQDSGGTTYAGNGGNSYSYTYSGGITLPFLDTQPKIQVGGGGAGGGISNGSPISGGCGKGQGGIFPFVSNNGQTSISSILDGYGNGGGGGVNNGGKGGDGVVIIYWQN